MREDLTPQWLAQQIIVGDTAPMCLELAPLTQPHDELLSILADQ